MRWQQTVGIVRVFIQALVVDLLWNLKVFVLVVTAGIIIILFDIIKGIFILQRSIIIRVIKSTAGIWFHDRLIMCKRDMVCEIILRLEARLALGAPVLATNLFLLGFGHFRFRFYGDRLRFVV